MFPSVSSCVPSTTVSTSFVSGKQQELSGSSVPVVITGTEIYYITETGTGYFVDTIPTGPGILNHTLHLLRNRIYYLVLNAPSQPVRITTTAGVTYTNGIRYQQHIPNKDTFSGTDCIFILGTTLGQTKYYIDPGVVNFDDYSVWWQEDFTVPDPWQFLANGPDYSTGFDVGFGSYIESALFGGMWEQLKIIRGRYVLSTMFDQARYIVKVNGVVKTPSTLIAGKKSNGDYAIEVTSGNSLYFFNNVLANDIVTVEYDLGDSGAIEIRTSATTPATLNYRSRISGAPFIGTIRISNSGTTYPANSTVNLLKDELVKVSVTSPASFLARAFYYYYLDGARSSFAIVNKNNYQPLIKVPDRTKKWYNYINDNPRITVATGKGIIAAEDTSRPMGNSLSANVDIINSAIILDPLAQTVNFFYNGGLVASLALPGGPISYRKHVFGVGNIEGTLTNFRGAVLYVLCNDFRCYRVWPNLSYDRTMQLIPKTKSTFVLTGLAISEAIPFRGDFTDASRLKLTAGLFPDLVALEITDAIIWLIGYNVVYIVGTRSLSLINIYYVTAIHEIVAVTYASPTSIIVTTKNHRILVIYAAGTSMDITPTGLFVLGSPAYFKDPKNLYNRVVVPDCHNRRLIFISIPGLVASFSSTGDFVPAYCLNFYNDNNLYVTGHDTNEVYVYNSQFQLQKISFSSKVTLVDVADGYIWAVHWLENRTTLDLAGVEKIIPFKPSRKGGSTSHVSADPYQVTMLGQQGITAYPAALTQWWVNGNYRNTINTGDYLGIDFRASEEGTITTQLVVGEHALDFEVEVKSDISLYDFVSLGTIGLNKIGLTYTFIAPIAGVTGTYPITFDVNFWGSVYNELIVTNNGVVGFDPAYNITGVVPGFATVMTDAILPRPELLYPDYPIDNRDPTNIVQGTLTTADVPGFYYTSGLIGEFAYFKAKYIGTTEASYPRGRVNTTAAILQTATTEINFVNFTGISVGDYISNPITSPFPYPWGAIVSTGPVTGPTQVVATAVYNDTDTVYWSKAVDKSFYVSAPKTIKQYSLMTSAGGSVKHGYYQQQDNTYVTGDFIQAIEAPNKVVIVNGHISSAVTNKWVFDFLTGGPTVTYLGITSIALSSINYTVRAASTATTEILLAYNSPPLSVGTSAYNSLVIGQNLYSGSFSGPETLVGKITKTRTYRLEARHDTRLEGAVIKIRVITTNVPDGTIFPWEFSPTTPSFDVFTDIEPTMVYRFPFTIGSPSYTVPYATNGTIAIQDNCFEIEYTYATNTVGDVGVEAYRFVIPQINSLINRSLVAVLQIVEPGNFESYLVRKDPNTGSVTVNEYYIVVTTPQTMAVGDIISSNVTRLTLPTAVPGSIVPATTTVNFRLHEAKVYSFLAPIVVSTPVSYDANFVTFSTAQTLPASTQVLFKPFVSHPTAIYEFAFFVGKNFQYLELQYDTNHNYGLDTGIRGVSPGNQIKLPVVAPTTAILGSALANGKWKFLGFGSFTPTPLGFRPRNLRYYRQPGIASSEIRYDIFVDVKIPTLSDVRAGLEYGWLYRNNKIYNGESSIKTGDVLTAVIPMGTNQAPSGVIFSLGTYQLALPVYPYYDAQFYNYQDYLLPGQAKSTNINLLTSIQLSETYWVPNYYKSAAGSGGNEYIYEILPSGGGAMYTLSPGTYNFLNINDVITVRNVFTGYRDYNQTEISLISRNILRMRSQTVNPPEIIDPLVYPILVEPFVRYETNDTLEYKDAFGVYNFTNKYDTPITSFFGNATYYVTPSIPATSATPGTTINLLVDEPGISFVIDGDPEYNDNVATVITGTNTIGLEWYMYNYFQGNATIFQIATDPLDGSDIYIEVGKWDVQQRSIVDAQFINRTRDLGKTITSVTIVNPGLGYDRNTIGITFSQPDLPTGRLPFAYVDITATGAINRIIMLDNGDGYLTPPSITITGPNTLPAVVTANVDEKLLSRENEIRVLANQYTLNKVQQTQGQFGFGTVAGSATPVFAPKLTGFTPSNSNNIASSKVVSGYLGAIRGYATNKLSYQYVPSVTDFKGKLEYYQKVFQPTMLYNEKRFYRWGRGPTFFSSRLRANLRVLKGPTFFRGQLFYRFQKSVTFFTDRLTYRYLGPVTFFTDTIRYRRILPVTYFTSNPFEFRLKPVTYFVYRNNEILHHKPGLAGSGIGPKRGGAVTSPAAPARDYFVKNNTIPGYEFRNYDDVITFTPSPAGDLTPIYAGSIAQYGTIINYGVAGSTTLAYNEILFTSYAPETESMSIISFDKGFNSEAVILPFGANLFLGNPLIVDGFAGGSVAGSATQVGNALVYSKSFQATDNNVFIDYLFNPSNDMIDIDISGEYVNHQIATSPITSGREGSPTYAGSPLREKYATVGYVYWDFVSQYIRPNPFTTTLTEEYYQDNIITQSIREKYYIPNPMLPQVAPQLIHEHLIPRSFREEYLQNPEKYISLREQLYIPTKIFINLTEKYYRPSQIIRPHNPELYRPYEEYPDIAPELYRPPEILPPFTAEFYRPISLLPPFIPEIYRPFKLLPPFVPRLYRPFTALPRLRPLRYRPFIARPPFIPQLYRPYKALPPFLPEIYRPEIGLPPFLPQVYRPEIGLPPFLPEVYRPYKALPPFLPEVYRPFYGYHSLPPEIYRPYENLPPLYPVIYKPFEAFRPWVPELMHDHNVYINMEWQLFKEVYWYQDNEIETGAFKSSFRFYADNGREGDYGQYTGVPPWEPNRPIGPILPYESNKGSALILKTPDYPTGGFATEPDAAYIAAKYVAAGTFQIVGTDYWNYRIFFDTNKVCTPRKSMVFPRKWYIRGA